MPKMSRYATPHDGVRTVATTSSAAAADPASPLAVGGAHGLAG